MRGTVQTGQEGGGDMHENKTNKPITIWYIKYTVLNVVLGLDMLAKTNQSMQLPEMNTVV
jgi:hypothetical protein